MSIIFRFFILFMLITPSICRADGFVLGWPPAPGGGYATPAFRSVAYSSESGSSVTSSTSSNLTVLDGDVIIAFFGWESDSDPPATVVCGSNTLSPMGSAKGVGTYFIQAYYTENASATTSPVTVDGGSVSGTYRTLIAGSYSGVSLSSSIDTSSCSTATCLSLGDSKLYVTAQDTTTTTSNCLLILIGINWDLTHTYTETNGYTLRTPTSGVLFYLADKNVTSTGTHPNGHVLDTDSYDQYFSVFVAFKAKAN